MLFSTVHCLLIKNGFGLYVVSFIAALGYQAYRRQLSINVIEFVGHGVLMLVMGRLVYLVISNTPPPPAALADEEGGSVSVDSVNAATGTVDFVAVGLLFCFASNIASFLFGISLGKSMEKDDGTVKPDSEPKKRWLDRRFVIKPKSSKVPSSGSLPATATATAADAAATSTAPGVPEAPVTSSPGSRNGNVIKLNTQRSKSHMGGMSSSSDEPLNPMEITIGVAKQTVLSILNLAEHPRYRDLPLMEIRNSSHSNGLVAKLFTTTEKTFGIYLSGSCHTYLSPVAVLRWLKQNSFTTGFEAIAPEQEITTETKSKRMEMTMRRLVSRPTSLMSSKRDFVVVTSVSPLEEAGGFMIASRSMPEDIKSTQPMKKKAGFLRGLVYGCGWILHPWATGEGEDYGCEVSFAAHIDMVGSATSMVNVNKQEVMADRTMEILNFLSATEDEAALRLSNKPEQGGVLSGLAGSPHSKSHSIHSSVVPEIDGLAEGDELNSAITAENRTTLLAVAKEALDKLRRLHATYHRPPSTSPTAPPAKESWDVFYEQNGVSVRELKNNASSVPVGILSAACTSEAPPHVVRQLLMNHPKEVDALLEGRTILSKLDQQSYIQWLAYGTIWPIGARDFLLATTEDVFDERTGDGFIIASTSIDHLCELDGEVVKGEADLDSGADKPSYTRSSLKLAGYVGVPNAHGGTDVSLFVDVDVYSYIPAWLLQVLAQYGLSEMMSRIQRATTGHPQMSFRNDITRMLSRIETTEAKMRSYVHDHNLPVPPDASYLFNDGGGGMGAVMTTGPGAGAGANSHTPNRRSMHERASFSPSQHMPVPSVEEAVEHRRASVRRHSMAALPLSQGGGAFEEFIPKTQALADEALHLMKVYLGLEELRAGEPALGLEWKEKKKEKTTTVFGTPVLGSTWNAVRAVGQVRADKADILKLLIDDSRIGEFDDMFDSCTVRAAFNLPAAAVSPFLLPLLLLLLGDSLTLPSLSPFLPSPSPHSSCTRWATRSQCAAWPSRPSGPPPLASSWCAPRTRSSPTAP